MGSVSLTGDDAPVSERLTESVCGDGNWIVEDSRGPVPSAQERTGLSECAGPVLWLERPFNEVRSGPDAKLSGQSLASRGNDVPSADGSG